MNFQFPMFKYYFLLLLLDIGCFSVHYVATLKKPASVSKELVALNQRHKKNAVQSILYFFVFYKLFLLFRSTQTVGEV